MTQTLARAGFLIAVMAGWPPAAEEENALLLAGASAHPNNGTLNEINELFDGGTATASEEHPKAVQSRRSDEAKPVFGYVPQSNVASPGETELRPPQETLIIWARDWATSQYETDKTCGQPHFDPQGKTVIPCNCWLEWQANLSPGKYFLFLRYTSAEVRPCRISVNGDEIDRRFCAESTGGWSYDTAIWDQCGLIDFTKTTNLIRIMPVPPAHGPNLVAMALSEPNAPPQSLNHVAGRTSTATAEQNSQPKVSVPSVAAQEASRKVAAELFGSRFEKAGSVAEKTSLSAEMIEASLKVGNASADQYVLLMIARDIAIGAGDAPTATKAVQLLEDRFDVPARLKAESLLAAAARATITSQHRAIAELASRVADEMADAEEYGAAIDLCEKGRLSAQKARLIVLGAQLAAKLQFMKKQEQAAASYRAALAILGTTPTDAAANLIVGRYLSYVKNDWERGVAYLCLGTDEELKAIATRDLLGAHSAVDQASIGNAWWSLAEQREEVERRDLQVRAGYWYRRAEAALPAGLDRLKVRQRLEELASSEHAAAGSPFFLCDLEPNQVVLYPAKSIKERYSVEGVRSVHGVFAHPRSKSFSSIVYAVPKGFRILAGAAAIADFSEGTVEGARTPLTFYVFGDGRTLWKSRPLQHSSDAQAFNIDVSSVGQLELRVDCPGVADHAWALWVDPVLLP